MKKFVQLLAVLSLIIAGFVFLALKKGAKPVDRASAELEHAFYIRKYAKRKEEGHAEKTN